MARTIWSWIRAKGRRNFTSASIRRRIRNSSPGRRPKRFTYARSTWLWRWPRVPRSSRGQVRSAPRAPRELAGLAARRRRRDGISRPTEASHWEMEVRRWARKGRARTIFACSTPAPGRCPAALAMSFNKRMGRFCSVGLQADTLDSSMCPPEGGRYREQDLVAIPSLKSAPRIAGAFVMFRSKSTIGAILALVWCLFASIPAHATTYYVAAAGSDSNNGTSTGTPWQTISKVNGSTFSAGDSVLFNRGDVWYGTSLTVPSSGSSGLPTTFGAYGSGANPIIKGSTLLVTSGFVLAPDTSTTIFSLSDSGTSSTDSATRNWREQVSHLDITANATKIRITVTVSATVDLNI